MTYEFSITGDDDREIQGEANYAPGTPDRPYLANGDPGYPGDPEEVEIVFAEQYDLGNWVEIDPGDLSAREEELIFEEVREKAIDDQQRG